MSYTLTVDISLDVTNDQRTRIEEAATNHGLLHQQYVDAVLAASAISRWGGVLTVTVEKIEQLAKFRGGRSIML